MPNDIYLNTGNSSVINTPNNKQLPHTNTAAFLTENRQKRYNISSKPQNIARQTKKTEITRDGNWLFNHLTKNPNASSSNSHTLSRMPRVSRKKP